MADLKAFAEQLVNLTVKEVNELATILKEEYGIEPAAAAVAVAAGPAAGEHNVLMAPYNVLPELLNNARNNRPAPNHRRGNVIQQQIYAHHIYARCGFHGQHGFLRAFCHSAQAEYLGYGWARNVRVQHRGIKPRAPRRYRKQAGNKRLANAALAAYYANGLVNPALWVQLFNKVRRVLAAAGAVFAAGGTIVGTILAHDASPFSVLGHMVARFFQYNTPKREDSQSRAQILTKKLLAYSFNLWQYCWVCKGRYRIWFLIEGLFSCSCSRSYAPFFRPAQ